MRLETLEIAADFRRNLARLNRRLRVEARETGLSTAKHSILGHLYREGPKTPGALAVAEGVQPQSVTRVLAELEQAGWATRRQDDIDRRQFKVEITPAGQEILRREAKNRALWLAASMELSLTGIEQEMLKLASQIMDRLANVASSKPEPAPQASHPPPADEAPTSSR
jgi:DNA-binding MarR family transcriptional regulator